MRWHGVIIDDRRSCPGGPGSRATTVARMETATAARCGVRRLSARARSGSDIATYRGSMKHRTIPARGLVVAAALALTALLAACTQTDGGAATQPAASAAPAAAPAASVAPAPSSKGDY
jgi:hypothetical protein